MTNETTNGLLITVQQLIDRLKEVEDKSVPITFFEVYNHKEYGFNSMGFTIGGSVHINIENL